MLQEYSRQYAIHPQIMANVLGDREHAQINAKREDPKTVGLIKGLDVLELVCHSDVDLTEAERVFNFVQD